MSYAIWVCVSARYAVCTRTTLPSDAFLGTYSRRRVAHDDVVRKQLSEKGAKDLNRHFPRQDLQMEKKPMKSSSPSLWRGGRKGRGRDYQGECGADGCVHYPVCSVGFMGVKDVKTYQNVQCKYVQFTVCQSYFKIMLF